MNFVSIACTVSTNTSSSAYVFSQHVAKGHHPRSSTLR